MASAPIFDNWYVPAFSTPRPTLSPLAFPLRHLTRSLTLPCTDAQSNLMTCVGVPLSVSRNHIILPYSEKHNFTIHGLFQNVSHWSTENPHGFKHGTTYIKNGKFIFRHVPNRQSLPVMHPINGSGYAVKSSIKFGTGAAPMFKAGSNDGSDKGARMEFDGTEVIFRVTPGMNLLVGDNVTFTLPRYASPVGKARAHLPYRRMMHLLPCPDAAEVTRLV